MEERCVAELRHRLDHAAGGAEELGALVDRVVSIGSDEAAETELLRQGPKAMPAILTTQDEIDIWMTAPIGEALKLQRPLADDARMIVARGEKEDLGGLAA